MPPTKAPATVHINLEASHSPIVNGCLGVPASLPRIETAIKIRSATGASFMVRLVTLELRTVQRVILPSKISPTETFREYKVIDDVVYRPPGVSFGQELLGLDIPVLYALPPDIPSSAWLPGWSSLTTHWLWVIVALGSSSASETVESEKFSVPIKAYDSLPLYRQFNQQCSQQQISSDNQVVVNIDMPYSAVGPGDEISMAVSVLTNVLHNHIKKNLKMKQLTVQIKEIMECHEGGIAPHRESKLFTTTKDYTLMQPGGTVSSGGIKLSAEPEIYMFSTRLPLENDALGTFEALNDFQVAGYECRDNAIVTVANIHSYTFINELEEDHPITHTQGFSSIGKFYSLRYEIVVKIKLSKGKDMDMRIPLTVSPYNRSSSEYLLQWIYRQCDIARFKFGKDAISWLSSKHFQFEAVDDVVKRQRSTPTCYYYNRQDWERLGFGGTFGKVRHVNRTQID